MDAGNRSVNIELNYEDFSLNSSTTLQNKFCQHSVYYAESSFLFNLEDKEAFDRDLIFDRKSLLEYISANDVDAVVRLCPYFTVKEKTLASSFWLEKLEDVRALKWGGLQSFSTKLKSLGREGMASWNSARPCSTISKKATSSNRKLLSLIKFSSAPF